MTNLPRGLPSVEAVIQLMEESYSLKRGWYPVSDLQSAQAHINWLSEHRTGVRWTVDNLIDLEESTHDSISSIANKLIKYGVFRFPVQS